MIRPAILAASMVGLSCVSLSDAASLADRQLLLPSFPPLITANCRQFPALNGPGVLCENFDSERNAFAGFQFTRLPVGTDPNDPLQAFGDPGDDVLGYTQTTGAAPIGTDGRRCSDDRGLGRLGCDAPVPEENDWHLHSKFEGPGYDYDPPGWYLGGAPDGGKAHSGVRSMHWGRHIRLGSPTYDIDSIRFRQVSAFVLDPAVNLGPASTLQFWHLISVPDDENAGAGFIPPGTTFGGGEVQISLMGATGKFEKWRSMTPSFNGYDSTMQDTLSICQFDPGDDVLPPSDDTMCEHSPVWSDLGDVLGTDATCTTDTDGNDPAHKDCGATSSCTGGPGCTENGSIGVGVWARSVFDLSPFAGRQARLRWIGSIGGGWSFGVTRSFAEPEPGNPAYDYSDADDGWYLDDIVLTDLRQSPLDGASDFDADSVPLFDDCDDSDASIWKQPSEVLQLDVSLPGSTLSWSPPVDSGATSVVYDLQRATQMPAFYGPIRNDFWQGVCVVTGGSTRVAVDPALPSPNQIFYYLVRARNACSYGRAALTTDSKGVPRDGRPCP